MNRRSFLRNTGIAAGAASLIPSVLTQRGSAKSLPLNISGATPKGNRSPLSTTLDPWVPGTGEWDVTHINHLYRRAGFGATMAEITAAMSKTPSNVVDSLLDNSLTTGSNLPPAPTGSSEWLGVAPSQIDQKQIVTIYAEGMMSIRAQWTKLMADPATMLRERMVLFWANHFVVQEVDVYYPSMMYYYLDYFRRNPWGNFKQIVKDVTVSPAMLYYLGGYYNVRTGPNENYARELMELFTLGINDQSGNPNYTQTDIVEMAKALTGWNFDPNSLMAVFNVNDHDSTFKSIFTTDKQNYGLAASGDPSTVDVIDWLFTQRGNDIAYFICSELYQAFVYHDTTSAVAQQVIQGLATTFQNGNWELKPVLSQLLKSAHFFDTGNIGDQIKSPYDYMVGMLRSFNIPIDESNAITLFYRAFLDGNQELLDPPNVKGWPGYHTWISTTTLPALNDNFAGPLINNSATGIAGYGGNGFLMTDAQVIAWAKQFPNYSGQYSDFLNDVATYMCAFTPDQSVLTSRIQSKLPPNYYEWPSLSDTDKLSTLRVVMYQMMLLANYQLM
jgi:uncharacterized protein (DUF1800 family)